MSAIALSEKAIRFTLEPAAGNPAVAYYEVRLVGSMSPLKCTVLAHETPLSCTIDDLPEDSQAVYTGRACLAEIRGCGEGFPLTCRTAPKRTFCIFI